MFKQQQQQMSHTRMIREELGQSLEHAKRAANHAASGIGEMMGPRMTPMAERMRAGTRRKDNGGRGRMMSGRMMSERLMGGRMNGDRMNGGRTGMMAELTQRQLSRQKKKKQKQQRRGRMMTMLAAGVAMGAMTAFIMRRRRQREWEEYEANAAMERAELAETGTGMTAGGTGQPGAQETGAPDVRL
ncbi:MAG TPA: hypothetical protein VKZ67_14360 [Natronosporangium sp.]|nr:hypothetical protein [Natronosporangium sp.]